MKKPTCYIIAGPNGAGKTTFAMEFLPRVAKCNSFINADLIAKGLSPLNADGIAMEAGKVFLQQIREKIKSRRDFAFETTLSGVSYLRWIKRLHDEGYSVRLYYLWVPSIQLTLRRIAERVEKGGHHIPRTVATRRFGKSLRNLFSLYLSAVDYCAIFDNASLAPKLIYEYQSNTEHIADAKAFSRLKKQAGIA